MKYTIGNMNFQFKKEAGEKMQGYLTEIKEHFLITGDSEVITDIEFAIRDKFENMLASRADKTLTSSDVEGIIQELGTVEMITGEAQNDQGELIVGKKLYRDIDDKIVAGVSSGLAHYFGIHPWIVRLVFLGGLFLPFPSVIPYIILWFILPMARTKTDVLRMKGIPVSLSSLSSDSENFTSRRVISLAKFILISILLFGLFALSALTILYFYMSRNVDTLSLYDETSYYYTCNTEQEGVDLQVTYPYMGNNIPSDNGDRVFNYQVETEAYIGYEGETRIILTQQGPNTFMGNDYTLTNLNDEKTTPKVTLGDEVLFENCRLLSIQDTSGNFVDVLKRDADRCNDAGGIWNSNTNTCK